MAKKWTKEENDLVVSLFDGTMKCYRMIADATGHTANAVRFRAGQLKLTKPRRKYQWNFNYFEKIDTPEKAYWLGFIYADGSVDKKRKGLRIGLIIEAEKHLNKFAKAIEFTGTVKGPYFDKKGKVKNKYTISLHHPKTYSDLNDKGVMPNKTYCIEFPHWLEKELIPHFIRGLFDGDGSISRKTTKYKTTIYDTPSFGFSSWMEQFCNDVADAISDIAGVERNKVVPRKGNGDFGFNYQGTPALRIRDWMYANATVWMECKKNKFYSYEYSSLRPQDKQHQTQMIDAEMQRRGWKRLSEYKGYYEDMTIQCDKGHIWTTLVQNFKNECGCRRCHNAASGERKTEEGKTNLAEIFAKRGWELLSEYTADGEIKIKCEHGNVFTMKRRCATRPHAQCDCVRLSSNYRCEKELVARLKEKGWKLVSNFNVVTEYVTVECNHGKQFDRLPSNIKPYSKCDCDKLAGSGLKGIYKQANGRWAARIQITGTRKTKKHWHFWHCRRSI